MALSFRFPLGKIIGFCIGLYLGGFWGAFLGLILGQMVDERREDRAQSKLWHNHDAFAANVEQATFTMGVIILSAKMAKCDGLVSRSEIEAFKRVFRIAPSQESAVGALFDQARLNADGYESYALRLSRVFRHKRAVLEEILSGLFIIGAADTGLLAVQEIIFLKKVAALFGFSAEDFTRIAARSGVGMPEQERPRSQTAEAFSILGVTEAASEKQIKEAYRSLIREHHPDKLMAQGVPPEFVATATEKMKRINVAYETVCKLKGMK